MPFYPLNQSNDRSIVRVVCILLMTTILATPLRAQEDFGSTSRMVKAFQELEQVDGHGIWFSYSIALAGCAAGLGLGGWALHSRPLMKDGPSDPTFTVSALLVTGAASAQIIHGAMRADERRISAKTARNFLSDQSLMTAAGAHTLGERAAEARSTRFWGGVITTAQGIGTSAMGIKLWLDGDEHLKTPGKVIAGLGLLNTAIGVIHFFGKPRTERIRDRAVAKTTFTPTLNIPLGKQGRADQISFTGVVARGYF